MLKNRSDGYNPWKHSTFATLCQQPRKNELITRELLRMYGVYIYMLVSTYVYHNNQPHVGKYTGPYMDPMGLYLAAIPLFCLYFFLKVTVLLNRICWWKTLSGVLLECEDSDPRKRANVPWKVAYFKRNVISMSSPTIMDNMDMLLFWGVICETPEANMNKRFIYCSWETQNLFLNFGIFFGPFFVGHMSLETQKSCKKKEVPPVFPWQYKIGSFPQIGMKIKKYLKPPLGHVHYGQIGSNWGDWSWDVDRHGLPDDAPSDSFSTFKPWCFVTTHFKMEIYPRLP